MPRPRKHSDAEIFAVARAVFLEHGPGASLSLVAERLDISQPALFRRFGTKERLLLLSLAPSPELPWVEQLLAGPDGRPLPTQLAEIARGAMDFFAAAVPGLLTLRASGLDLRSLLQGPEEPAMRVRQAMSQFFAAAGARGLMRPMDPDRVATMFIGGLQARAMMAHIHEEDIGPAERRAHALAVVDLLWRGIQTEDPDLSTLQTLHGAGHD